LARFLLSTELLLDLIHRGGSDELGAISSRDLAASALSFELILAEIDRDLSLTPVTRRQWRANTVSFRQRFRARGGRIIAISESTLEKWGHIWNLELYHTYSHAEGPVEMSSEERLVVATALAEGLIYVSLQRDWNAEIENK
jgi:hypothetical protein